MAKLVYLAVGYAVLYLIALGANIYWLTFAVGISLLVLLVLLALKVDAVDESLYSGYNDLKKEVKELKQQIETLNQESKPKREIEDS